jgi:hypothetical protein
MLLAFVLLGRAVEERAKLRASSDMAALLNFLPTKARLIMGNDNPGHPATVEVPCDSLAVGDVVLVLPGVRSFPWTIISQPYGFSQNFTNRPNLAYSLPSKVVAISGRIAYLSMVWLQEEGAL